MCSFQLKLLLILSPKSLAVTAPIEGGHANTVRDAGYYAEITEVTIKHG